MTTTATARTPRRPPAATTASRRRARRRLRHDQRHGPAGPDRGVQGALVDARTRRRPSGIDPGPRRGDRPGRRRRRRRHQLLDQRHARRTSSTRWRSRSCSPPTPASSSPRRPATAARPLPPSRTPARGLTTVAAGTHNRDGQGSVTLGNGTTYNGASIATAVGPAPLDQRVRRRRRRRRPRRRSRCASPPATTAGPPVLDPAKVAGKIVVCDRGVNARVNKSLAVQQAGGVGMILVNTSVNSINADFHFVPTVHLPDTDRAAVKAYAATAGATATINQSTIVLQRAGAVHGRVLVARSAPRGWRRPAQAGRDRARPGHPRRRRASGQRRPRLQPPTAARRCPPARRRRRGPAEGPPPDLVADGDQVGADDQRDGRARRAEHEPARDLPPGRRPRPAQRRGRSGPRLRLQASTTGWRSSAGRRPAVSPASCTALVNAGFSTDASDFNGGLDRDRRPGRRPDRHTPRDQRRQHGGDLHRVDDGPRRDQRGRQPELDHPGARTDEANFTVQFTRGTAAAEHLRRRPADVDGRQPQRPDPDGRSGRSPSRRRPRSAATAARSRTT